MSLRRATGSTRGSRRQRLSSVAAESGVWDAARSSATAFPVRVIVDLLATRGTIDDLAAMVAQFPDAHLGHTSMVSRVILTANRFLYLLFFVFLAPFRLHSVRWPRLTRRAARGAHPRRCLFELGCERQ